VDQVDPVVGQVDRVVDPVDRVLVDRALAGPGTQVVAPVRDPVPVVVVRVGLDRIRIKVRTQGPAQVRAGLVQIKGPVQVDLVSSAAQQACQVDRDGTSTTARTRLLFTFICTMTLAVVHQRLCGF
jgi:hypothetical protein